MGNTVKCVFRRNRAAPQPEPHVEPEPPVEPADKSRASFSMARPEDAIDITQLAETLIYKKFRMSFAAAPDTPPQWFTWARNIVDANWKDSWQKDEDEHPAWLTAFSGVLNGKLMKLESQEAISFLVVMAKLKRSYYGDKEKKNRVAFYQTIMDDIYNNFVAEDAPHSANVGGKEAQALKQLKGDNWMKDGELIDPTLECRSVPFKDSAGVLRIQNVGEWHCAEQSAAICVKQAYSALWDDPKAKAWLESHTLTIIREHEGGDCELELQKCDVPVGKTAHSGHYNELLPVMHHKHHESRRSKAAGAGGVYSYESYPLQQHVNYDVYDHQMQPVIGNKYEYDASSVLLPMLIMVVICVVGMCAFCVSSVASWIACYLFAVKEERKYMKCNNDDVADVERGFNSSN